MKNLKNKTILYLVHRYGDFQKDQIEVLSKQFKRVYVIVRYKPIADFTRLLGLKFLNAHSYKYAVQLENKPENIVVFIAPLFYLPTNKGYQKLGEKHYKSVLKIIKNNNISFDIIHSHFAWSAGYVGMKLKDQFNKPFVLTTHGYDIYDLPFRGHGWKSLIRSVINSADISITVNKKNLLWYKKIGTNGKNVYIISNGYNNHLFFPIQQEKARSSLNLKRDKKIILTVGNIVSVKGHKYLIDAVAKLKNIKIQCIVIGEGELRKNLMKKVRDHNLSNKINFIGHRLHSEINLWMNACDLFVLPSLSESFGIVQLEAMACGKPVVATINGGSEEVVTSNDYGLLCEKENDVDLADKIEKALDMKWDKEKIIQHSHNFYWEKICEKIHQVYMKVSVDNRRISKFEKR